MTGQGKASNLRLVAPAPKLLASYAAALATGWSPNNVRDVSQEQLALLRENPDGFIADLTRQGGTITLGDGRTVPKLPFRLRWMIDPEFCGQIALRWPPRGQTLPPYALGHIGYAVVPWKRRRGYATQALRLMLEEAREIGLELLEITSDPDNTGSRRVIEANGGQLAGELVSPYHGPDVRLRYIIDLRDANPRMTDNRHEAP